MIAMASSYCPVETTAEKKGEVNFEKLQIKSNLFNEFFNNLNHHYFLQVLNGLLNCCYCYGCALLSATND